MPLGFNQLIKRIRRMSIEKKEGSYNIMESYSHELLWAPISIL